MLFLSYAKEDAQRAERIFSVLSGPTRQVFYDKDALMPGMDWRLEIEEKVRKSNLIVLLLSRQSVSKEGFVQREVRLALDRAEMMPDGRVFIIPVRLDDVEVPTKLAKYQWLDMFKDEDVFDLEYSVQYAERLLAGKISSDTPDEGGIQKSVLRERVVILLQGKNGYGDPIFTYLELSLWKLQQLREKMRAAEDFVPSAFGRVVLADRGEPSAEIREAMAQEHNMIDVPRGDQVEREAQEQAEKAWMLGFEEAYRVLAGADALLPEVERPIPIENRENALREGLQFGMHAARAKM